jgi:hypothetical protein
MKKRYCLPDEKNKSEEVTESVFRDQRRNRKLSFLSRENALE